MSYPGSAGEHIRNQGEGFSRGDGGFFTLKKAHSCLTGFKDQLDFV